MEVKFNGERMSVQVTNLGKLLLEMDLLDKTGIAVAINSAVIPKSKWKTTELQTNDEILIITAAAGG